MGISSGFFSMGWISHTGTPHIDFLLSQKSTVEECQ
jgi:hypothetical protein